jgi:hypothetical protein
MARYPCGTQQGRLVPDGEIAAVAAVAGFRGEDAITAVSHVWPESSGWSGAVGCDPGGTQGLGLWQITAHTDALIKAGVIGQESDLFDPQHNARAAKWLFDRQGWGAWAPSAGAALLYRQRAQNALANQAQVPGGGPSITETPGGGITATGGSGIVAAVESGIVGAFGGSGSLFGFLTTGILRVLEVIGGAIVFAGALVMLIDVLGQGPVVPNVVKAAGRAGRDIAVVAAA